MNQACLFLARVYLKNRRSEKNISAMVILCFAGIFIGTFALSLVLAIMSGFEMGTYQRLQSIHPHLIMQPRSGLVNFAKVATVIQQEFPQILACAPSAQAQALLAPVAAHKRSSTSASPQAILIKAIDPICETALQTIATKLVDTHTPLPDTVEGTKLLMGKKLCESLGVTIGDTLELWYADEQQSLCKQLIQVGGMFSTGMEEFDANFAYCSFDLFSTLSTDSGTTHVHMRIAPGADEADTIARLKKRFNMAVYSWKDLYPALVSALKLQKYALFAVLLLITLVASINMLALLSMFMLKKKVDIAVLTMIGATPGTIKTLFMLVGLTISSVATATALVASWLCALLLKRFPFISLPDTYYVTHLPVSIELGNFIVVGCVTMLICFAACWFATTGRQRTILPILKGED